MACDGNNATAPSPGIAPGSEGIDPRAVAREIGRRCAREGSVDPRLAEIVPGFDAPFFQAGLAGYSDAAMRIIAREHGCPLCVTEALLDRSLLGGGRGFDKADLGSLEDNVPGGADDHPLVGQIMGSDPAEMAAAAIKMVEQGARADRAYRDLAYADGRPDFARQPIRNNAAFSSPPPRGTGVPPVTPNASPLSSPKSSSPSSSQLPTPDCRLPSARTFATIDVNLACPVKKVAKKARGGHWLAEPDGAIAILEAVRAALPESIPVTVKMRRSFDDTPEMAASFWRIYDAAYDLGCAWVTVHGRTVEQRYIGPSRWDLLRDIVRARPGRIVFGSGDIWNADDIFRMIAYTGVTGASVARGCIGNPWIFRRARQMMAGDEPTRPTLAEQRRVLERHFALALRVNRKSRNPELLTARCMRKFAIRFSEHHPESEPVRRAFIACRTMDEWRRVLEEHYLDRAEAEAPRV